MRIRKTLAQTMGPAVVLLELVLATAKAEPEPLLFPAPVHFPGPERAAAPRASLACAFASGPAAAGSIAFWFKPDWDGRTAGDRQILAGRDAQGKVCFNLWLWHWLRADLPRAGLAPVSVTRAIRPALFRGDWHHFALVWDESGWVKLYVDGLPYRHGSYFSTPEYPRRFSSLDMAAIKTLGPAPEAAGSFQRLQALPRALSAAEVVAEFRRKLPVDLLLDRSTFLADRDDALELLVAPAGAFARPSAVPPLAAAAASLTLTLERAGAPDPLWSHNAELALAGPQRLRLACGPQPAGDYRLRCEIRAAGESAQRTFFLAAFAPKPPPVLSEKELQLDAPVFTMDLTEAPGAALLHEGPLELRTTAAGKYLETSGRLSFPVCFPAALKGKPVLLEITWPDDKPRSMGLYMYREASAKQNRDRLQGGLQAGLEYPNSGSMQTARYLFYPGGDNYLFEARSMTKDYPAALARLRVLPVAGGRLPKLVIRRPEGVLPRTLGHMDEDQTPDTNLNRDDEAERQGVAIAARIAEHWCDYFDYTGQSVISYPVLRYGYVCYPLANFFDSSLFPQRLGGLGTFIKVLGDRKMQFLATLNLYTLPEFDLTPERRAEFTANGYFVITADGEPAKSGHLGLPKPDFHHPEVKEMLFWHLRQIAERYGRMPAFLGFDIWAGPFATRPDEGYGDSAVAAFVQATGVVLPPAAQRDCRARCEFLNSPAQQARWRHWRAARNCALLTDIVACIKAVNPDLQVNFQVGGPVLSGKLGGESEGDVDTRQALLAESALDLAALAAIPGLQVVPLVNTNKSRWQLFWNGREHPNDEVIYDPARFQPFAQAGCRYFNLYPTYFETRREPLLPNAYACYFENADIKPAGRHFLKQLVYPLAMTDAQRILIGAQPIGTLGRDEETREFAQAYCALPALPFQDVPGARDPALARCLTGPERSYLYVANLLWSDLTGSLRISPPLPLEDLSTGALLSPGPDGMLSIPLRPYQLRSFIVKGGGVSFAEFASRVPAAVPDFYTVRLASLAAIAAAESGASLDPARVRLARIRQLLAEGAYAEAHRLLFSVPMNALRKLQEAARLGLLEERSRMIAQSRYAVNCGQETFLASPEGTVFFPDQSFDGVYGHRGSYQSVSRDIQGLAADTSSPALYAGEAYDLDGYQFKVQPGAYTVRLRFRVGYAPNAVPGKNVVNLEIEGRRVLENYDLFVAAGADARQVLVREFPDVIVQDGILDIAFSVPRGGDPTVRFCNAIEVIPE